MKQEIEFANGDDSIDTQGMKVTYKNLDVFHPEDRFPSIYQQESNGTLTELALTPKKGKWLADVLTRMYAR